MFSQIFTVVLAVLTFVAAAPATGLQGPMAILCSVNAQSAGAKAAYNLGPGIYRIFDVQINI
ncbi:hypothetical protein B0H13DRAFT_2359381 [Mycena leptocephala]|nr:hypothetical protein B0H13DRAFT_2359381 [Mycena leptocephala]